MIKTTAQKLREQGWREGRKEGRNEGREEGRREGVRRGQVEMLRVILRRRFGGIPAALEDRIDRATPEALKTLVERALDAETVDELLES